MKAQKFLRSPVVIIGVPVLIVGLAFDLPALVGLFMSLLTCALLEP